MAALVISLTVLVAAYAVVAVAVHADREPYPGDRTSAVRGDAHPAQDAVRPAPDAVRRADAAALVEEAILTTWRLTGQLPIQDYQEEMERLAAEDDLRHPLAVPPE